MSSLAGKFYKSQLKTTIITKRLALMSCSGYVNLATTLATMLATTLATKEVSPTQPFFWSVFAWLVG